MLEQAVDANGNLIHYGYVRDGGRLYLAEIRYGTCRIAFDYESRPDPIVSGQRGVQVFTSRRCRAIRYFMDHLQTPPCESIRSATGTSHPSISLLSSFAMTGIQGAQGRIQRRVHRSSISTTPDSIQSPAVIKASKLWALPATIECRSAEYRARRCARGRPSRCRRVARQASLVAESGRRALSAPTCAVELPRGIQLDARNVAFTDLTGTATADLFNLEEAPFGFYINEAGKGWTKSSLSTSSTFRFE